MVVIVDYGMGNVASVKKAIEAAGQVCSVSADESVLGAAQWIFLPGVGAFKDAMNCLSTKGLDRLLSNLVVEKKKPFIGICLGMQVLAEIGHEDGITKGLGWVEGEVKRIPDLHQRVPHMGWNDIVPRDTTLFKDITDNNFYFMHSYHFEVPRSEYVSSTVLYGTELVASVHKDNIFAFQFHPEKSQAAGIKVLKNLFDQPC